MSDPEEAIDLHRMQAAVGSMLFLWARIERLLEDSIKDLAGADAQTAPHSVSCKIARWESLAAQQAQSDPVHRTQCSALSARLRQSLKIRNMICHGLWGANAGTGTTVTLTTRLNAVERTFTWNELQAMFRFLDRAPRAIEILSSADAAASRERMPFEEEWLPNWSDAGF